MGDRNRNLKFVPQKEIVYNKLLPYASKLDLESETYFSEIKTHLGYAFIRKEIFPEGVYWINHLIKYVKLYGRKFSKDDHIQLIYLLLDIIVIPDLPLHCIMSVGTALYTLMKKIDLLSRDDLQIAWRPLYDLYERIFHSPYEQHGMILIPSNLDTIVKGVIRYARAYFSIESTQEMLDEWRPLLCPYDTVMSKGVGYLSLFLCTKFPPEHHDKGFKLWFDELIHLWELCQNCPQWENNILWLFARLARDSIGYINWEPYIPLVFNRLLKVFNLPCGPNKTFIQHGQTADSFPSLIWIVSMMGGGSSCLMYLKSLFKALESFYHPSNNGRWVVKLQRMLHRLPMSMVKRIHRERHCLKTWETVIPKEKCLTDEEIEEFILAVKPIALLSMFSKGGSVDSAVAFHNLAILRPELIIPPLIDRLYSSLETLTEPHRLIAAMHCMVSVTRVMVKSSSDFPEGPSHVVPLLMGSLPGIDPNDIKKCLSTFHFISTMSALVFFVDSSNKAYDIPDLSEAQQELYLSTAGFEDFVLLFMDRCFMLIENSSLHQPSRMDRNFERMNTEESFMEACLASTFSTVLTHSSPAIYKVALKKVYAFVTSNIFEVNVSGKNAANMCRSAAKVNPELALQLFMPYFTQVILSQTESEDIFNEERLDNELLFSLLLMSEIIRCDGIYVLKYLDDIEKILNRTLRLKCREGYKFACGILRGTLRSFTLNYILSYCSIPNLWSRCEAEDSHMLINEWGLSGDIDNLGSVFHVPTDEELKGALRLLELFLLPELERLKIWATGALVLTRDELQRSLRIVDAALFGAAAVLPLWKADPIELNECTVPLYCRMDPTCNHKEINTSDGQNFRTLIADVIQVVLEHMMETCEDDTKSLLAVISIFQHLSFHWGMTNEEFDIKWKSFHIIKKSLENKLYGRKSHIRALLVDRTSLQNDMRVLERNKFVFTDLHSQIMKHLYRLSTSHYFDVRSQAQNVLQTFLSSYPYCYKIVLPDILLSLAKDPTEFHEEFKGTLYLILSCKQKSLITFRDWELLHELWPAVITAKHSEKPSIIKLFDSAIMIIQKFLDTIEIDLEIPKSCEDRIKSFCLQEDSPFLHILQNIKAPVGKVVTKRERYCSLVGNLVSILNSGRLHWRLYQLAFSMLAMLIRYDIKLPAVAVNLFVSHLVYDTIAVRKAAVSAVSAILKQQKRLHPLIEVDPATLALNTVKNTQLAQYVNLPENSTNLWLQYNSSLSLNKQEEWDKAVFVHKTYTGFNGFKRPFKVYAPNSQQPKLDRDREELADEEQAIYDLFMQEDFLDKIIRYFSLEDRKGHDKFSPKRFEMYKGLFRNFGNAFLPKFLPHLHTLVADKQESSQRCAAEIIAGFMRGSKHWPFQMQQNLKDELKPILQTALQNVTPETFIDWQSCVATASEDQDPNKNAWLFELLMERPIVEESGSFLEASWMSILLNAVMQQEWRVCELLHRILAYLMPRLDHSYQNVRDKIGSLLCSVFMYDVPLWPETVNVAPKRKDFMSIILPKIAVSEICVSSTNNTSEEVGNCHLVLSAEKQAKRKDAVNLFHTICRWVRMCIVSTHHVTTPSSVIFQILPALCAVQNDTSDEIFHKDCVIAYTVLSQALLFPEDFAAAVSIVKQIMETGSWHSKASALTLLQHIIFTNMFSIVFNKECLSEIKNMFIRHLHDERIEVREAAAEALSGMLHCEMLKVSPELLSTFKSKCNKKLKTIRACVDRARGPQLEADELRERHAGILGLCACISSFPYDVPDFMPEILVLLADHLHDPQPIQSTIKKTLSNFRRTHHDSWRDHKLKFTDDQLSIITDLLVSPSYYA